MIDPIDYVMKIYVVFGKMEFFYYDVIDLDAYGELSLVDGDAKLKTKIKKEVHKDKRIYQLMACLISHLNKNGYPNFGIDIINKRDSDEFYVLDMNPGGMSWIRFYDKEKSIETLQKGLTSYFE